MSQLPLDKTLVVFTRLHTYTRCRLNRVHKVESEWKCTDDIYTVVNKTDLDIYTCKLTWVRPSPAISLHLRSNSLTFFLQQLLCTCKCHLAQAFIHWFPIPVMWSVHLEIDPRGGKRSGGGQSSVYIYMCISTCTLQGSGGMFPRTF